MVQDSVILPSPIYLPQVLSGKNPFEGITLWEVPPTVFKGDRPAIPDGIPPKMMELWNIAKDCWSPNPRDRPQFSQVHAKLTVVDSSC